MPPLRLPRTIQLDRSDSVLFTSAAAPGEWAVTGSFLFDGEPPEQERKARIAFRTAFLGVSSFGFSTLVVVTDLDPGDRAEAVAALARNLVERLGAPDIETARTAAEEEIGFAASLCAGHGVGTLIALQRAAQPDGSVRERYRTLRPRESTILGDPHLRGHDKAFFVVESDEPDDADRTAKVDLVSLLRGRRP